MEQWKYQLEQLQSQLEQWLHEAFEYLNQIYAAVAVLLFSLRLFKRSKSNTIVLAGLSGSGKTILFHQGTVTSMEPNESTFVLHSDSNKKRKTKPVRLVDVPGHSRLQTELDEFLPHAAGIVFVVGSLELLPKCRLASEYLYDILTKASVVKKKIPVLKATYSKEFITKQMEKEIDKLRASRSRISLSAADIPNGFTLGVPGEAFAFSQCRNNVTLGVPGEAFAFSQCRNNVTLGVAGEAFAFSQCRNNVTLGFFLNVNPSNSDLREFNPS